MSQLTGRTTFGAKAGAARSSEQFPDPYFDMASMAFPDSIQDALKACEDILSANGPYREAMRRVISYFITDVVIESVGPNKLGHEEKKKYEDFLNDTLGIKTVLHTVALDYLCYGNSFTSLLVPFRRYLGCPGCGLESPLKKIFNTPEFQFSWTNYQFHATCPHCQFRGKWRHVDRRSGENGEIKIKRWNPHEIDILHDPYTDDVSFIWKIPDEYRNTLRQGKLFHLERASWELVQAVQRNQHLLFDKDIVYHMKEEALAGIRNRGWGISKVLTNFRQAYYVQVLHRYNEAIALDYVIPFRVITPQPRQGQGGETGDPVLTINMGSFTSRVQGMIQARRRDPARWNILPFPIEYQALGGDATQLAPKELLEFGQDTLLNAAGVPMELYKGNISATTGGALLRLFEANWSHLVHNLNRFLARLVEKVAQIMSWEPVVCKLQVPRHADDLNKQMAQLQLMMGGQISKTTGLAAMNLDYVEETRKQLQEEQTKAEETKKVQQEMEQAALMDEMAMPQDPAAQQGAAPPGGAPPQPGAMPAGGAPQPGGMMAGAPPMGPMGQPMGPQGAAMGFAAAQPTQMSKPTTPEEMQQQAQTIAQTIMTYPESQKDSELIRLKKTDPTMHALVTSLIEDMRQQAARQGQDMMMQQMYGKQAAAVQLPALSARQLRRQIGTEDDLPVLPRRESRYIEL